MHWICCSVRPWALKDGMAPRPFVMKSSAMSYVGFALSRFGPTVPPAPASDSVWHVAQPFAEKAAAPGWVDAAPTAGALEPYHVRASRTIGTDAPMARAIGRFEIRRSGRRSRKGHDMSRIIHSVGMMIV